MITISSPDRSSGRTETVGGSQHARRVTAFSLYTVFVSKWLLMDFSVPSTSDIRPWNFSFPFPLPLPTCPTPCHLGKRKIECTASHTSRLFVGHTEDHGRSQCKSRFVRVFHPTTLRSPPPPPPPPLNTWFWSKIHCLSTLRTRRYGVSVRLRGARCAG